MESSPVENPGSGRNEAEKGLPSEPFDNEVCHFVVGAGPVKLIRPGHRRVWCEAMDWHTGQFAMDMAYLTRATTRIDAEIGEVSNAVFKEQVRALGKRRD